MAQERFPQRQKERYRGNRRFRSTQRTQRRQRGTEAGGVLPPARRCLEVWTGLTLRGYHKGQGALTRPGKRRTEGAPAGRRMRSLCMSGVSRRPSRPMRPICPTSMRFRRFRRCGDTGARGKRAMEEADDKLPVGHEKSHRREVGGFLLRERSPYSMRESSAREANSWPRCSLRPVKRR